MPRDIDGFEAYMADMYASGDLFVTPEARELAIDIVLRPPVPLHLRPLVELVNQITVGWLPGDIRRQYGFSWDPLRAAALRGGAEYVKRDRRANRGSSRYWTTSAMKFANTIRITPSRTIASITGTSPFLATV